MAGAIPLMPRQQFSDANGVPLAGGFVNVYLAGTTARSNTWQDRAQTTLNTNPIQLDASGSCAAYVDEALIYKIVVTDADGAVQTHLGGDNVLVGGPQIQATVSILAVDDFTGDGATSSFTLSVTPTGENNTQVFFDGVYQTKTTYSLLADAIVFASAPANGVSIEVCTLNLLDYASVQEAIIQAAGAAATVAYIYPGTFATAPTTRPDGDPIQDGDRYINSTDGLEYIRVGGVWTNAAGSAAAAAVSAAAAAASAAAAAATVTAVTEHSQSFTGAGPWTLTGPVTTITKIFVNGIYYRLTDFSIAGLFVTYTGTAPINSLSRIDICYVI